MELNRRHDKMAYLTTFRELRLSASSCHAPNRSERPYVSFCLQVSPAAPRGGRRRRGADVEPDERRRRFLERNRAAAYRCRQKRKVWVTALEKRADELATSNVSLTVRC